jgi:hypothetical protein
MASTLPPATRPPVIACFLARLKETSAIISPAGVSAGEYEE